MPAQGQYGQSQAALQQVQREKAALIHEQASQGRELGQRTQLLVRMGRATATLQDKLGSVEELKLISQGSSEGSSVAAAEDAANQADCSTSEALELKVKEHCQLLEAVLPTKVLAAFHSLRSERETALGQIKDLEGKLEALQAQKEAQEATAKSKVAVDQG